MEKVGIYTRALMVMFDLHGQKYELRLDEISEACGAANTLVVERLPDAETMGSRAVACRVMNTDASAAVGCLSDALGGAVAGKRFALIGAGGAARAIAAGLVRDGATVVVYNRSRERADETLRLSARDQRC